MFKVHSDHLNGSLSDVLWGADLILSHICTFYQLDLLTTLGDGTLCVNTYSAALGSLQPSPPGESLHIHPSPTDKSRRQILTVNRKAGSLPSFSQLDGDGDPPTATPHDPYGWPSNSTPCSENVKCSLCWDLPEHLRVPNVLYMVN